MTSTESVPPASHLWIDDDESFLDVVDALTSTDVFGVDTEFHREKSYFPQLALVQISWDDQVALVDPLSVDMAPFAAALTGPAVVVMHAASQDMEVLLHACNAIPRDLFDTQIAAAFTGSSLPSLVNLVDRYYGTHLPKGDRLTDWLRRPLGESQRTYAASDVEYLLGLREKLRAELEELGRLDWAVDECDILRERGLVVRSPEDAWTRIKEARSLKGEAAAVARSVAEWRERRAAQLDQPVRFVLSDLAVVGIAQRRPVTAEELVRIRGVDERHARGAVGESLLAAVAEGRLAEPPRAPKPSSDLDRRLRPAVSLVAAWIGQLARDLSVETSMLATRADIEALLAGADDSRLLAGWRADLVGEPIQDLVSGKASLAFDGRGNLLLEPRTVTG